MHSPELRLLIVDDDPVFRKLVSTKLAGEGTETLLADTGTAGLELARGEPFDLALVDLGLPDIDGFEVIEHLRSYDQTRHIPIIIVTGREDSEAIDKAFDLGATSFLTKPINWKLFEHHIAYVLRSSLVEKDARQACVRAKAESRIKDQLTSRIKHCIGPRAGQISASAEMIARMASSSNAPAALHDGATNLMRCADTLIEDLSDMMFLTQAISGALDVNEKRFKVSDVVGETLRVLSPLAMERGIELKATQPAHLIRLEGDFDQLMRAYQNLVENAIQHSPRSSAVVLGADLLPDGSLHLFVEDGGPGIPMDLLAHLLSPLNTYDVEIGPGRLSGLGLAISRLVAEAHGGSLNVRTAVGSGTTAGLHLPTSRVFVPNQAAAA